MYSTFEFCFLASGSFLSYTEKNLLNYANSCNNDRKSFKNKIRRINFVENDFFGDFT